MKNLQTKNFIQNTKINNNLKINSNTIIKIKFNPNHNTTILDFIINEHKIQINNKQPPYLLLFLLLNNLK